MRPCANHLTHNRLLALRRFADDPEGILATVYGGAFVGIKCRADFGLRVHLPEKIRFKLGTAAFADTEHGSRSFDHAELSLYHESSLPPRQGKQFICGFQTAPLPKLCRIGLD